MANLEPRRSQDGLQIAKDAPTEAKIHQHKSRYASMLKNLKNTMVFHYFRGPTTPKMDQDAPKRSLIWLKIAPKWSQDGQVGAKMAKLERRWSQHDPKIAKDAPT